MFGGGDLTWLEADFTLAAFGLAGSLDGLVGVERGVEPLDSVVSLGGVEPLDGVEAGLAGGLV